MEQCCHRQEVTTYKRTTIGSINRIFQHSLSIDTFNFIDPEQGYTNTKNVQERN